MSNNQNTVSVSNWVVTLILLSIPLVNLILLIVWSFSNTVQPSKKTFAQASLIVWLIVFVLAIVLALFIPMLGAMASNV